MSLHFSMTVTVEQEDKKCTISSKYFDFKGIGGDVESARKDMASKFDKKYGVVGFEEYVEIFNDESGLESKWILITPWWECLIDIVLEKEPLIETRDAEREERKKRISEQEHLSDAKK